MEPCIPYSNHFEHILDLIHLTNLKLNHYQEASVSGAEETAAWLKHIEARSLASACFLPVNHLIKVFQLDEIEQHILHTLTACQYLKITGENPALSHQLSDIMKLYQYKPAVFPYYLNCITKDSQDFIFDLNPENHLVFIKARIIDYIFSFYPPAQNDQWEFFAEESCAIIKIAPQYSRLANIIAYALTSKGNKLIWLFGKDGLGKKHHVKHFISKNQLCVFFVKLSNLRKEPGLQTNIKAIIRECFLFGSALCILTEPEDWKAELFAETGELLQQLNKYLKLVFIAAESEPPREIQAIAPLSIIEITFPGFKASHELWQHFGKAYPLAAELDFSEFVNRYKLTPRQIQQVLYKSHQDSIAQAKPVIEKAAIFKNCQEISTQDLAGLGQLITPLFTWEDLILPKKQKNTLQSALSRIHHHKTVYADWGFNNKLPYGKGLKILLTGSPGTGKTMAAQVMAAQTNLSIFRIDLASLVNKYIGETEKNIKKVFDQAKGGNCILFFDEADSLFGRRTQVTNANDKNANMEVSYLLQQIEEYGGVIILATNLLKNFDEAFKRRFHFIIDFPFPDFADRKTMWRQIYPEASPLAEDIDYEILASYPLSGSNIKNIALASAFLAAQEAQPISMPLIIEALRQENEKCGLGLNLQNILTYADTDF